MIISRIGRQTNCTKSHAILFFVFALMADLCNTRTRQGNLLLNQEGFTLQECSTTCKCTNNKCIEYHSNDAFRLQRTQQQVIICANQDIM